jgi:hypothetical protein
MVGRVIPLATSEQTLGDAAAAFLAQPSLARSTRRSYDQTLTRQPLSPLSGPKPAVSCTQPTSPDSHELEVNQRGPDHPDDVLQPDELVGGGRPGRHGRWCPTFCLPRRRSTRPEW